MVICIPDLYTPIIKSFNFLDNGHMTIRGIGPFNCGFPNHNRALNGIVAYLVASDFCLLVPFVCMPATWHIPLRCSIFSAVPCWEIWVFL